MNEYKKSIQTKQFKQCFLHFLHRMNEANKSFVFRFQNRHRNEREQRIEENMSLVCNRNCHVFCMTKLRRQKVILIELHQ